MTKMKIRLDGYHAMVVSKYFQTRRDFFSYVLVCKKFRDTLMKYHTNPIPLGFNTINYFEKIETLNIWCPSDETFGNQIPICKRSYTNKKIDFFKIVVWFTVSYNTSLNTLNGLVVYKKIKLTQNDVLSISNRKLETEILRNQLLKDINLILTKINSLDSNCFCSCDFLTEITLPDNITSLGGLCISGCKSLTKITLSKKLDRIDQYCFSMCQGLSKIDIPNSVKHIEDYAFNDKLNEEVIDDVNTFNNRRLMTVNFQSPLAVIENHVYVFAQSLFSFVINDKFKVHSDEMKTFEVSKNVCLDIPSTVLTIESHTFENVKQCSKINFESDIFHIGEFSFNKLIEPFTFGNCISLTKIELPKSVRKVESHAFAGCANLVEINFLGSIETLEEFAFSRCIKLTKFNVCEWKGYIGNGCFSNCDSLKELNMQEGVTEIGETAFQLCKSLSNILIPRSVTSIGLLCFDGCISLKEVRIPQTTKFVARYTFLKKTLIIKY
ncbi:hypothetical protein EIN_008860 [Entamoeba invadens IP1]|uniref:Leucine rich repeat containing protein BspA family protein n=1 Tax=Entamoeba invadens IP1 TaxID=370355 RepID=A0A0A1TUF6_ENTIV|nr:hypothetical protein EIN_008860 [Entamoeba invadens IP1]ELP83650.1 hypothetical protein EIN_008860 [Entamoeba invadens IP1]|eukprot:XP_004182996.1 hypothetical protein EIN_008860 [Entamoeba invadens IP1]